jgi:hypothetical protein
VTDPVTSGPGGPDDRPALRFEGEPISRNKASVPDHKPSDNGRIDEPGEAYEPPATPGADLSFDPAELEADVPTPPPTPAGQNIYDPAFLGLTQDFEESANTSGDLEEIKVEKPPKSRVFRVHPSFVVKTTLLELKEDSAIYLVHPDLVESLADEPTCGKYILFACVTKNGTPFLWPIKAADGSGKWNSWPKSAYDIALKARQRWCRIRAHREASRYVPEWDKKPPEQQAEPAWPDWEFTVWLTKAFKGCTIDSLDHQVLKQLQMRD